MNLKAITPVIICLLLFFSSFIFSRNTEPKKAEPTFANQGSATPDLRK